MDSLLGIRMFRRRELVGSEEDDVVPRSGVTRQGQSQVGMYECTEQSESGILTWGGLGLYNGGGGRRGFVALGYVTWCEVRSL